YAPPLPPGSPAEKPKPALSRSSASRGRAFYSPAGRTLRLGRLRIELRKAECHHDGAYALRAIPHTAPCREFRFLTIWVSVPVLLLLCEEKLRQLCAAGRTLLKKSSSVVFRSQNGAQPGGA